MNYLFSRTRVAAATLALAIGFALPASAEVIIRAATDLTEGDNPQTHAYKAMQEYIAFRSNGELKLEVYYGGALGSGRALLEQIQANTLHLTVTADGPLANFYRDIQVLSVPYLFSSTNHALTFFNTSPFFRDLALKMEKETKLKVVMTAESGFRNMTNNAKPITTPEDMVGLKMRTMESPVFMELMRSVGAAATPIAFDEVILALKQGVVDGQENAVATVRMYNVWEVQKYMSITEHVYSPGLMVTNADFWNELSDAHRQIFADGIALWATVSNAGYFSNYAKDIEFMKSKGMEIYVNTAEEKEQFKAVIQPPVLKFIAERVGQETVDAFVAAVEETRKQLYAAN